MAIEKKFRVIQLDECYVAKSAIPKRAWTPLRTNVPLDMKEITGEIFCIIAAVSREKGLEHFDVFERSITKIKWKMFLEDLRNKNPFDDIILIMDQLSLHKSRDTVERYDELGFMYAYTPVQSP